jgi:hypothetical protein
MRERIFFFFALILLVGCNTVDSEVLSVSGTDDTGYAIVSSAGVTLRCRVEGDALHCFLSAATGGWVAVGFVPSQMMKDANLIIGYVADVAGHIRDDWGVSQTEHDADVSLGGTDNVVLISASETGGVTLLEFTIPMNSGDVFDKALTAGGDVLLILARGDDDNFTAMHSAVGTGTLTLP